MLRIAAILALFAVAAAVPAAAADDAPPPYQPLEDRNEGVLSRAEIEPGRKITLFSLRVATDAEPPPDDPAAPYRVAFWVPDSADVHVLVREYESRYKMEMRREVGAGPNRLEWPPEIVRACGLRAADLQPLVAFETPGRREYAPAVVYRDRPSADGLRYVFTLVSRVPVTLLDWELRHVERNEILLAATERGIASHAPFEIVWTPGEGEDADPLGAYDFTIRTTLQPQPGTPARKETRRFRFRHEPERIAEILAVD